MDNIQPRDPWMSAAEIRLDSSAPESGCQWEFVRAGAKAIANENTHRRAGKSLWHPLHGDLFDGAGNLCYDENVLGNIELAQEAAR